jgi:CheY-specific phosphatase CheX
MTPEQIMDVKFINFFLNGTLNVLKTIAFVAPEAGKYFSRKLV